MCLAGVLGFFSGFLVRFPSTAEGIVMLSIPIAIGGFLLASGAQFGRAATRRKELEGRREQAALGSAMPDEHLDAEGRMKSPSVEHLRRP
jgi:hypothetical protein